MAGGDFTFKQFSIRQDRCAMKVGTDGVLLGAWADVEGCRTLLDAGTGTGLVALMAAQRAPEAAITAIDIDEAAVTQAAGNVTASPFAARITVRQGDMRTFDCRSPFDGILCNPPYFSRSLHCPDSARTTARHDDTLSLDALATAAARLLTPDGTLSVVLPTERSADMVMAAATQGLFLKRETKVYTLPTKQPKRVLMAFARHCPDCKSETLCIEDTPGTYSPAFIALMKDFYLKM